jgi:hypothetical protein
MDSSTLALLFVRILTAQGSDPKNNRALASTADNIHVAASERPLWVSVSRLRFKTPHHYFMSLHQRSDMKILSLKFFESTL